MFHVEGMADVRSRDWSYLGKTRRPIWLLVLSGLMNLERWAVAKTWRTKGGGLDGNSDPPESFRQGNGGVEFTCQKEVTPAAV